MARVIYDSGLSSFLGDLSKEANLIVPTYFDRNYHDQVAFKKWRPDSKLALNYSVTVLPPKEFLMEAKEVLFNFKDGAVEKVAHPPQIVFGLSIEDLEGLARLDRIMDMPVGDESYKKRRESTFVIGLDKFSPPTHLDFDLYFQEFNPGVYGVTAKSRQGKKWLASKHFRTQSVSMPRVSKKLDPILSDPQLGRAIKESYNHPVWEELAKSCFACGICSYVCPLCYCFDVQDEAELGDQGCGKRCRQWDSCFLSNFATTTCRDFRPGPKERIYNWYYHKFYRMNKEYGFNGCVDCNRCTVSCPAKINFRRVLAQVLNDYKKRPQK